ncbi:NAD/NADP octopine/nopaline dehydrogenase family protein [Dactylosporangium sp. CA-233914]|uniref:NAD/NADP octopine/nopaline dehydrogenase family protein n=1 Tax=Dactylosporangium sp. CA-233914 TaxID=3239934 RepID=UPI003D908862
MSTVAILGAGAGGCAAAVELVAAGHTVRLWNRGAATLAPHLAAGGVRARGVLGAGLTRVVTVTTDLAVALDTADVAVVCLPALAHEALADDLVAAGADIPLVLNPGHTLGAAHVAARYRAASTSPPPIAEFSTLTYVARKDADGTVHVTGRAGRVRAAAFGPDQRALAHARDLWPAAAPEPDVLATSLANVNLVLHPPAAVLAAAWVEATGGDFRYYAEATTPAVAAVMHALDEERLAVARAYGHDLDPLVAEMHAIGTVDTVPAGRPDVETLRVAVATGAANATIRGPGSLTHRYYREDFPYGVVPFLELARIAGVAAPTASALLTLADTALGGTATRDGLTLARLGLYPDEPDALRGLVTEGTP